MKKSTKPARRKSQPTVASPSQSAGPPADDAPSVERTPFPIVGIGASAGGLEALELFLRNVPQGSGMAFVIVQHLDPTHNGIMAELLQRTTPMTVAQVKDRTRVEPDCVYVIPPNKDMSVLHGVLHLLDPVTPRGLRLPIDFFLRSLAEDSGARSIAVILSGMGMDGTVGLQAVKEKGGVVFVQDPASAKFDGMPRSAIDSGLADVVAPVEALPGRIITYRQHVAVISESGLTRDDKGQSAFEKIAILLRAQTGHDFSLYKKNTVYRRIERRMALHQIDGIDNYVRFLQENPQELDLLFKELLIGVTSFFRDPAEWEAMKARVIPALLESRAPSQALRVWIPACATGEEAYSLAIVFREALEQLKPARNHTLQIFATDLAPDAIEQARAAVFPAAICADVSQERLSRFFVQVERGYQVAGSVRKSVIFAPQNVIMDPPFTKLDIVICRNLLIYLTPELQKKLLPIFHYGLNSGGFLFLGNSETIGECTGLFTPLSDKSRIYRRLESNLQAEPIEFPLSSAPARTRVPLSEKPPASLQSEAEQLLLQRYSPAAVLVNDKGDIVFISGRTGSYLEPAAGKANWNLFAMAREGLCYKLTTAFRQALTQGDAVTCRNVEVGTNGGRQTLDLTVQRINEPETLRGLVMVVFTAVDTPPETGGPAKAKDRSSGNVRVAALEQELNHSLQDLQTTREEMQTFQEEARSANEELQSTNEELQSTNEELTTSKEEMQSMNEELQTLNAELQSKVDNLSRLNNDMKNLLDNTEIAALFLDAGMHVRLFTAGANLVFRLIPSDKDRLITDIVSDLTYPELADHAREVIRTLVAHEQLVSTSDGRWFTVRIMPYRTLDNVIDGVAITFMDITAAKTLEKKLRTTQADMEKQITDQNAMLEQSGEALRAEVNRGRCKQDGGGDAGTEPAEKAKP